MGNGVYRNRLPDFADLRFRVRPEMKWIYIIGGWAVLSTVFAWMWSRWFQIMRVALAATECKSTIFVTI